MYKNKMNKCKTDVYKLFSVMLFAYPKTFPDNALK